MKPETEELLYYLEWSLGSALHPTWHNLDESFEDWAWRNHLGRRLAHLQRLKLVDRHPNPDLQRVVRLTRDGREFSLGGRNPTRQWNRPWDGQWRLILFDLPVSQHKLRQRFLRALRQVHFGCLQGSVWVSPDSARQLHTLLAANRVQADVLIVVEGRPATGESDQDIVRGAWDFALLQQRYERYLAFLNGARPRATKHPEWCSQEIALWRNATQADPMLPRPLLPTGYLGIEALDRREAAFADIATNVAVSRDKSVM